MWPSRSSISAHVLSSATDLPPTVHVRSPESAKTGQPAGPSAHALPTPSPHPSQPPLPAATSPDKPLTLFDPI